MPNSVGGEGVVAVGDVIEGRYRILKPLGEGGMGMVFLAEHALIKRRLAIKILHPELAKDADVVEQFMNEARAAGTLGHPNIVESTDMGFTGQVPYIVFEYLEGTLLTDEIYRVGGLPVRRAVRIAQQIASALYAAHNAHIVHRDLKSDNVFLTDKAESLDHVKILDFGISRFLELDDKHRGVIMGTPEFMAPEQITEPEHVDKRADIYALGVILYEMLAARRPFSTDQDPRHLMQRIVRDAPPPLARPEVPHALEELIVHRLLAKDPRQRMQSMADVESALDAFTTQSGLRKSRPIAVPDARSSSTIPRPKGMTNTPWPVSEDRPWPRPLGPHDANDGSWTRPLAAEVVSLPARRPTSPWLWGGIAAAGLLVGVLGLAIGLRGHDANPPEQPVAALPPPPAPAAAQPMRSVEAPQKILVQVDADAPNARVTFRRRVSASPAAMQLAPSDIVELVEVSAPGYKTVRYWLTFDRTTHLKAHLLKGDGLTEASEEATLVALGEIAAPEVHAAPAVAKVAEPARPAPAPAPLPAPRKIGKSNVDATRVVAATDTSLGTTAPVEALPEVEPAKPEPPKAEPANPEPPADAKPDFVDAPPVKPRPAIDNATVTAVVGSHRPEVLKCFADGKKKDRSLHGTITLQLAVDASGKVARVQVQSTLTSPLVAGCVVKVANSWRFPARAPGEMANVAYPFTIN
jgi:eukaryotic-like serine/threonine-protein kinase